MIHNVLIADDHQLFTQGLVSIINNFKNFEVIGTASNGADLLAKLNNKSTKAHVIILDICMPKLNGIETLKQIKKNHPQCKVLVCTMYYTKSIAADINEKTVQGIISKTISVTDLELVLNKIVAGETHYPTDYEPQDACAKNILENDDFYLLQQLTKREKQLLALIKEGLSSKKIAAELSLSEATVSTHRSNICQKLKIKNPAELVAFAHKVL